MTTTSGPSSDDLAPAGHITNSILFSALALINGKRVEWELRALYIRFRRHLIVIGTQEELEEKIVPPPFNLAKNSAQMMALAFTSIVFSTGLPAATFVGFFGLLAKYWVDKYSILRVTKAPPQYDETLAMDVLNKVPLLVALHSVTSVIMLYQLVRPTSFTSPPPPPPSLSLAADTT